VGTTTFHGTDRRVDRPGLLISIAVIAVID
jgi:hypothetical protein